MSEQTPLLVTRERNPQVDELSRDGRKCRSDSCLLFDARRCSRDERACRRHWLVPRDCETRLAASAEPIENDCSNRGASERRRRCETLSPRAAVRARVGGHEHQRVLRHRVRPDVLRSESAGELDESRRPRRVVSDDSGRPRVVSVSNDDDRILGSARNDGDDVVQLDVSQIREVLGPHVLLGTESESRNRLRVPTRCLRRSLRARHARRELGRQ